MIYQRKIGELGRGRMHAPRVNMKLSIVGMNLSRTAILSATYNTGGRWSVWLDASDNDARFGMGKAIPQTIFQHVLWPLEGPFGKAMTLHQPCRKWLSGLQGGSHAIAFLSLSYSYLASENL
jgi:hypothetical protein